MQRYFFVFFGFFFSFCMFLPLAIALTSSPRLAGHYKQAGGRATHTKPLAHSASQTVSSCWLRKWLGEIVHPRTLDRCGTMRFHTKVWMKCTSSS